MADAAQRPQKIIIIAGTNASGKSALGLRLAQRYGGEILSADSRQVYRGFDLVSGKVTREEAHWVPHHLLDILDIGQPFSVADFQRAAYRLIPEIAARGKQAFIVGGTGLYISSVAQGYVMRDESSGASLRALEALPIEELRARLPEEGLRFLAENPSDYANKRRIVRALEKLQNGEPLSSRNEPRYDALQLGVTWPREILHRRIQERLDGRIEAGMLDEVRAYLDAGGNPEHLDRLGLEYRHTLWYLTGKYASFDEFREELARSIRQFAKRQLTWFRRDGAIVWLDMERDPLGQASDLIDRFLEK